MGEELTPDQRQLLVSGGKAVRFICTQTSSLWANAILKRRDAALAGIRSVSSEEKNALRNAPFHESPFLFPTDLIDQVRSARDAKDKSSFMGNVAKLAANAQRAPRQQAARPDASSSTQKKKKQSGPPPPKRSKQDQKAESKPPPQSRGKSFRGGKGPYHGPKGRGKGKGAQ